MAIKINFDSGRNPETPTIVLAKRNGDKIGLIEAQSIQVSDNMNDASELSFNVYRDLNGKRCAIWDDITNFKLVHCVEWDMWYEIKVDIDESVDEVYKTVECIQLGHAELSQINLYNIQINTKEDILRDEYKIPTVLYYPEHPEASLLHRIMEKAPHYKIAHVDSTIAKIQRVFEFNDTSIYDAFQEIAEEINCLFVLDSKSDDDGGIARTVSVYDLESNCKKCGYRGEFVDVCPKCKSTDIDDGYGEDTGIFVTADELANSVQLSVDTDNIKNCFKLEGGDDMMTATIRNCNPNGSDYIWYVSNAMKNDMSKELVTKLGEYDVKYAEYYSDKNYRGLLNESSINQYNDIIERYRPYIGKVKNDKGEDTDKDKADQYKIPSEIKGYKSLMNIYYNVIDLVLLLKSGLMPNAKLADTDAKKEAAKLTKENISPVAAQSVKNMSKATADNVVLSMAKVIVDSRYQIKVNASSWNSSNKVWTGSFVVTNYSDKEDKAISNTIDVVVNDNYETFVKQKIEKALAKGDAKDMSIAGLFKLELAEFKMELKKYALNRLVSFNDACQSAIDILVEQGVADKNTWGNNTEGKNLYDHLYVPYKDKLDAIQSEMNIRQKDIEAIDGVYDEKNALVTKGLKNYIEDVVEDIQEELDFEKYLGNDLWLEFCSFRRDDKYSNENYVSDGLGNSELINKAVEFIDTANKEIYKSNELQTSVSADLYNLLVIDKFKPIINEFKVGNWIRVAIDGVVYKLRLINYEIDYDDLSSISVEFADEVRACSTVSSVQDVINQASSMATSYDTVKRQAKQGEQSNTVIDSWFSNGLDTTNTKIISGSDGQSQTWDNHGMLFRKYDVATGDYEPTQMKIINSTLAITTDNWDSTKTAVGEYYFFDNKTGEMKKGYGVNAETIVGKLLIGEDLILSNSESNLEFGDDGLSVWNNKNKVDINPNSTSIFNITNMNKSIFSLNDKGELVIVGNITALNGSDIGSGSISGLAKIATTGEYDDLEGLPAYLDSPTFLERNPSFTKTGSYNLLTDKPHLSKVASSGQYRDLEGLPNLFSGNYNDLSNKPTKLSQFTNDSGFITKSVSGLDNYYDKQSIDSKLSAKANSSDLSSVATSGRYDDLSAPSSDTGKLLYVGDNGSITSITIDKLKEMLGI